MLGILACKWIPLSSLCLQAISCHYASSYCEYIEVEGASHENIAEEVMELARKKLARIKFDPNITITFQVRYML